MFGSSQQNTGGAFNNPPAFGQQPQQGVFGQQQQQPAAGFGGFGQQQTTPAFGQPATNAFGSGGGSAFGASTTTPFGGTSAPAFGQPQQQQPQSNPFGGASAAPSTGFGGFASSTTGTGSAFGATGTFGTAKPAFGATGSGFGTSSAPAYGSGAVTFGQSAATPVPQTGTANPAYAPVTIPENEAQPDNKSTFMSISCMDAYKQASFEELRYADYQQNRKSASATGTTSAFGQTRPAFGGGTTGSAFGATPSPFGQSTSSGGAFASAQPSTSLFGQQQSAATPTFGQPAQQTSAFGQQQQPAQSVFGGTGFGTGGGSSGAFGTSTGGAFGQTQPATSNPFGGASTTTAAFGQQQPAKSIFGTSTTGTGTGTSFGTFGTGTSTATGAFGAAAPANNPFGGTATSQPQTGGGLFGNAAVPGTNNSAFGGGGAFGAANKPFGSTPTTGTFGGTAPQPAFGAFGQQQQNQQQQQPATGSGLFGQSTTTGGGLFGQQPQQQTQQQQQQQQPGTGGLFGGGTSAGFGSSTLGGGSGFGAGSGGLFGNKPAGTTFGQTAGAGGGGGLFGSTTQQPPMFGGSSFGQNPQQGAGGFSSGGLFGSTNQQQHQPMQQPSLQASVDQNAYGNNPIFANLGSSVSGPAVLAASLASKKKAPPISDSRATPRTGSKITKLRGFSRSTVSAPLGSPTKSSPLSFSLSGSTDNLSRSAMSAFPSAAEDTVLSPNAFVARPSAKKLLIKPSSTRDASFGRERSVTLASATPSPQSVLPARAQPLFDPEAELTANDTFSVGRGMMGGFASTPVKTGVTLPKPASKEASAKTATPPPRAQPSSAPTSADRSLPTHVQLYTENTASEGDYWMSPSFDVLQSMSASELRQVHDFTVGRKGYGQVRFQEPVDLTSVSSLRAIPEGYIVFEAQQCTVYPDDIEGEKPPIGKGLNVPAVITLQNCFAISKEDRQPIRDPEHIRAKQYVNKLKKIKETTFVDYDAKTGQWMFRVEHW